MNKSWQETGRPYTKTHAQCSMSNGKNKNKICRKEIDDYGLQGRNNILLTRMYSVYYPESQTWR